MFRELRRKKQALSEAQVEEILKTSEYGLISTIGEDGYPYSVQVNYVYGDNCIYFHCAKVGHKLDNIAFSNKVSFTITAYSKVLPEKFSSEYESVIVFGQAREVEEDEKLEVLLKIIEKYSPEYINLGKEYIDKFEKNVKVIKVGFQHVSGKGSKVNNK